MYMYMYMYEDVDNYMAMHTCMYNRMKHSVHLQLYMYMYENSIEVINNNQVCS